MHYSSLLGAGLEDASHLGWGGATKNEGFSWTTMAQAVHNHIKKLNFSYRNGAKKNGVEYINAYARFKSSTLETGGEDVELEFCKNPEAPAPVWESLMASNVLIATGGRPSIPKDVKGEKYTRNEWRRCTNTLETSGEDVQIHSKRVEEMYKYTRNEWRSCTNTLETS
jgi:pyruvate/2-oxoglutarate dehydrogenase complex dihydrolipoamide dehydrogenase (E3) component